MFCFILRLLFLPLIVLSFFFSSQYTVAQKDVNHLQILFDNNMMEHLEAEYLWTHTSVASYVDYLWTQPSQLSLEEQKKITYYRVAELSNNKSSAIYDLTKIANAQSDFYFSELSSFHLANYYFNQKQYNTALGFIKATTPFATTSNTQWTNLMLKKAYCLYKSQQYVPAYELFSSLTKIAEGTGLSYALFYQGFLAYLLGNYPQSITAISKVDRQAPFSTIAPLIVEQALVQQSKFDSMVVYAKSHPFTASKEDSLSPILWKKLVGYAGFQTKQYDLTIENYKDLPIFNATNENDLGLVYQYAYSLYKRDQSNQAETVLEYVFTHTTTNSKLNQQTALLLATIYLTSNQKEKARTLYGNVRSSLDNKNQRDLAAFLYAKLSLELGYINDAVDELRRLYNDKENAYQNEIVDYLAQALAISKDYEASYALVSTIANPSTYLQKLIPTIYHAYALLLIRKNDYTTADSILSVVEYHHLCSKKLLADVYFWKSEINIAKQDFRLAAKYIESYEDVIKPDFPEDRVRRFGYNYGYLLLVSKNYAEALPFFNKAVSSIDDYQRLEDWEIDALVYQADCHLMLKHYSKAYHDYESIANHKNKYSDYAYYQNCQIMGYQNPKEKEKMIDNFERMFPESIYLYKSWMEKVDLMMNEKRYEESISLLHKINTQIDQKNIGIEKTDLLLKLGLAKYNTHNYDDADSIYQYIIVNYPNTEASKEANRILRTIAVESNRTDQLYTFLGSQHIEIADQEKDSLDFSIVKNLIASEGKSEDLKKSIQKYLSKHPQGENAPQCYFILAEQEQEDKNFREAITYYQNVLSLPKSAFTEDATMALSKISYFELQDYELSKDYFERIRTSSQNTVYIKEALRGLLRIYYKEKNWGRGYPIAKALEQYPIQSSDDNDLIHIIYGKSFLLDKAYLKAITEFQQIDRKSYYYPEVQYEIGRSYLAMGKLSEAKETALAITKLNTPNTFFYSRTYLLLGEIFIKEKDFFNAKATLSSLAQHTKDAELKKEVNAILEELSVSEESQQ